MDERRKKLLKEIVESYIKTVKPIGSKSLCKKFKCSSATIRNEMAVLETLGYIEKNHVSSGRIPSEAGYRYYVENLMEPKELSGEDMLKLQTIFKNHELKVSDAITRCMEIISEMTHYTSVVLGNSSKDNSLQQVSIIPLDEHKIVALVCTDKGIVENRQFTIPDNIFIGEVVQVSEIINKMLIGTPIDEVSERLEFEIKPIIAKKIKQYETVYHIFYDAFNDFAKNTSNVVISGKSKMLDQPEYQNVEEVRTLIGKFDDEDFVRKIESKDSGINIYIGEENEFDPNVTIIKSKFHINGEEGTIAIVGPKRMEYDRVVGLLSYLNENLQNESEKD